MSDCKEMVITRILLHNWMNFKAHVQEMDYPVIAIYGNNGSGKTVIEDAISLIWYGERENYMNLCGEDKRNAGGEIHWNTKHGILRPSAAVAYIILEFRDINGSYFHQGVRIQDGEMRDETAKRKSNTVYFMGEGRLESIGATDRETLDAGKVQMTERGNKSAMFPKFFRRRGFSEDFILSEYGGKDCVTMFRDMNRALVRNDGIKGDMSEYVRQNVFRPTSTQAEVNDMVEHLLHLQSTQDKIHQMERKADFLEAVIAGGIDYLHSKVKLALFDRVKSAINVHWYRQEIQKAEAELAEMNRDVTSMQAESKAMDDKRSEVQQQIGALQTPPSDIAEAMQKITNAQNEQMQLQQIKQISSDFENARDWLKTQIPTITGMPGKDKKSLDEHKVSLDKAVDQVVGILTEHEKELEKTRNNLSAYTGKKSSGDLDYNAAMIKDARALQYEIADRYPEAKPQILFECIDSVKDESWQEAAERFIGKNRFGIIVSREYYDAACRIQHDMPGNRKDIIILNTKNMTDDNPVKEHTIAGLFTYTRSEAESYVASRYGDVVLAETDQEYSRARRAIRRNGQYKLPGQSIKPGSSSKIDVVLGEETRKRRIAELQKKINELHKKIEETRHIVAESKERRDVFVRQQVTYETAVDKYDPRINERIEKCEKRLKAAQDYYDILCSSDEERERKRKIEELQKEAASLHDLYNKTVQMIGAIKESMRKKTDDYNSKQTEYEKHNNDLINSGLDADDIMNSLTDYELEIIEAENWKTAALGTANIRLIKKTLGDNVEKGKAAIKEKFKLADILQLFVNPPTGVESEQDLTYFQNEYQKVKEIQMSKKDEEQIKQLIEAMKRDYTSILRSMRKDWEDAKQMRVLLNQYLSNYKIGSSYYRIHGITLNPHAENAEILDLALRQGDGYEVTQEDIQRIHKLCMAKVLEDGSMSDNIFDYRKCLNTYLEHRTDENPNWRNAREVIKANSTGQQEIMRYILKVAVIASQVFTSKSCKFIMLDEAMKGVDEVNKVYFFDAIEQMSVRCLLASQQCRFSDLADRTWSMQMERDKYIRIHTHTKKQRTKSLPEVDDNDENQSSSVPD